MHALLRDISSVSAWESGKVRSAFFEHSDIDFRPKIKEICLRIISWLGENRGELISADIPYLSDLKACMLKAVQRPRTYIDMIEEVDDHSLEVHPIDLMICAIRFKEDVRDPLIARADLIRHTFDEVTRYLPESELSSCLLVRKHAIEELVSLLEEGNWEEIVASYKSGEWNLLAYDSLRAFKQGKISMEQFCTLIFRWSLEKDFSDLEIDAAPLFNADGSIHEEARDMIRKTLRIIGFPTSAGLGYEVVLESHLDLFYQRMKKMPKSEQYFFHFVADPLPPFSRYSSEKAFQEKTRTITQEVQAQEMNIFNTLALTKYESRRMSPSLSMMQQLLIAYKGDLAVKITPVIGLSTVEDIINNGLQDTREMALPFPGIELPKKADGVLAPADLDFWNHDFYHSFVVSHVPIEIRRLFIQISESIKKIADNTDDEDLQVFANELFERFIDMELGAYRRTIGRNSFLISLHQHFSTVYARLNLACGMPLNDVSFKEKILPKLSSFFDLIFHSLPKDYVSKEFPYMQSALKRQIEERKDLLSSRFSRVFLKPENIKQIELEIRFDEIFLDFLVRIVG